MPVKKAPLKRERKVKDRARKEKTREGSKFRNKPIPVKDRPDISRLENRIFTGDAETVLKRIPDESVDIVLTSPPYNFGLDYGGNDEDSTRWDEYFSKIARIWSECCRVLIPGGRLIVNVQPLFSDYVPTHHIISNQLHDLGLLWKGEILWEKNNYNCKYTAWGSWASPSMPYLKYTWEFVEIFTKETHKKVGDRNNIDIDPEDFKKWVVAKWSIAPERKMKEYDHPAMFPEELVNRLLKLFSYRGDLVLDPFSGVGTTAVVARQTGRRYIGIDISAKYNSTAKKRLLKTTDLQDKTSRVKKP